MENRVVNLCDSSADESEQNICRLCSVKSDLIDLFAPKNVNLTMRILILLATGIEIKQNDSVSKMVCHRCCEIAVKLHKYRTNAVANDKLLREQSGLPYAPPITDQEELLRVASAIVNEQKDAFNVTSSNNCRVSGDPLELLKLSFKKDAKHDINDKSIECALTKTVKDSPTLPNQCRPTPKIKYKHPSIQKLFNTYKDIILPEEVFKSDISPVITLNSADVSDWYAEQFSALKEKLKGITFKPVPCYSIDTIPPSSSVTSKCTTTTSSYNKPAISPSPPLRVPFKRPANRGTKAVLHQHNEAVSSMPNTSPSSKHSEPAVWTFNLPPPNHNKSVLSTPNTSPSKHKELASWTPNVSLPKQNEATSSITNTIPPKYKEATSSIPNKIPSKYKEAASSTLNTTPTKHNDANPSTINIIPPNPNEAASSTRNTTPLIHNAIQPQTNVRLYEDFPLISVSKDHNVQRNYSQVVEIDDDADSDDIDREECPQYNSDCVLEGDISRSNLIKSVSSVNDDTVILNHNKDLEIGDQPGAAVDTSVKRHKHPSARKKTGGRSTTKRRRLLSRENNTYEEEQKDYRDICENLLNVPAEIGLAQKDSKKVEGEGIYKSLLISASTESPPELVKSKTHIVFMCPICNKLYDSKKDLMSHERTHLKCKFCKKRVNNLKQLNKHQNESCFINIVKNKPIVKLRKVDSVPSLLKQYAAAFQRANDGESKIEVDDYENVDESRPTIEEVVLPMPPDNSFMESEDTVTNTNLATANDANNSKVVCISISDDSDDEIKCMEIPRHTIIDNTRQQSPNDVDLTSHNNILVIDKSIPSSTAPLQKTLTEKEMIRSLFKKHSYPLNKSDKFSQTFSPTASSVKYTKTNLIILDEIFSELAGYKIPVHLESQPKISARFKETVPVPEPSGSLEYWAFKKPIGVEKRIFTVAKRTSSDKIQNNTLFLNLMKSPSTSSRLLGALTNCSESLINKPPTVLQGLTSNGTISITKPTFTTTTTVPFTLSPAVAASFYNNSSPPALVAVQPTASFSTTKQPTNYIQILGTSTGIQYKAPIVPQTTASLLLGTNNENEKKLVHINNNVTNINKFFVIANNVQQIPTTTANVNYETSYLNNICANLSLPQTQTATIREVETVNQNKSVVLHSVTNEPIPTNEPEQNCNNRLRVKNISELTENEM